MKITILDKFKSYLALNKREYWWNKFTDYELELSRMTLTQLASELDRTKVRKETVNEIIVEHMLAVRLVRLQTRASWWSGWLGLAGAMLAAALTFYLGQLSVASKNVSHQLSTKPEITMQIVENKNQPVLQKPVQKNSNLKVENDKAKASTNE